LDNRSTIPFPVELVDLFFGLNETVHTNISDEKSLEYCYAVCTVGDGSQIYITTHIFYEDLHDIQKQLINSYDE